MDVPPTYDFVIDEYTHRRGNPAMLQLSCAKCSGHVILYQKDGPGPLLRCYMDRIHEPPAFVNLQNAKPTPEHLVCPNCGTVLGKSGIYEKELRLAFFLVEGSISVETLYEDQSAPHSLK